MNVFKYLWSDEGPRAGTPRSSGRRRGRFAFDPHALVRAERGRYVAAALTIVRAYITSGERAGCGPIGSYGGWSRFAREPLVRLSRLDPVDRA
jgi:putative DNA primase/helicase